MFIQWHQWHCLHLRIYCQRQSHTAFPYHGYLNSHFLKVNTFLPVYTGHISPSSHTGQLGPYDVGSTPDLLLAAEPKYKSGQHGLAHEHALQRKSFYPQEEFFEEKPTPEPTTASKSTWEGQLFSYST